MDWDDAVEVDQATLRRIGFEDFEVGVIKDKSSLLQGPG
jgi:hypothetical protein